MSNYNTGLVAVVDALGFKGIYNRYDPEVVLDVMTSIESSLHREFERYRSSNEMFIGTAMGIRFLSDTVVVTLQFSTDDESLIKRSNARFAAFTLCEVLLELTAIWATSSCPLAFRGAIGFGKYCAKSNYLIGTAVDDAAEAHIKPDGAFIFLTAELTKFLEWDAEIGEFSANVALVPYRIPTKGGGTLQALTLHTGRVRSHLSYQSPFASSELLQSALISTFETDHAESLKKRNTRAFFSFADEWLASCR